MIQPELQSPVDSDKTQSLETGLDVPSNSSLESKAPVEIGSADAQVSESSSAQTTIACDSPEPAPTPPEPSGVIEPAVGQAGGTAEETAPVVVQATEPSRDAEPTKAQLNRSIQSFDPKRFWWLATSFIIPFFVLSIYLSMQSAYSFKICARSGIIGVVAAVIIFGLYKLDCKISNYRRSDVATQLVLQMLGMMLWLVWVGASHVMVLAHDELYPPELSYVAPSTQRVANAFNSSSTKCIDEAARR